MKLPEIPRNQSRQEMRKALIRLRMEMHRQEIRHESRELLQPLNRARGLASNWQQSLGIKHAPLWGIGIVTVLGFLSGKGAKGGDVMTKTHAFGSGTSYGMRYLLKMIFNVAIGEEDDDGNSASGDDFRNAILDDLISKVAAATEKESLQMAWQHGLKVLHAAKDAVGAEELRGAVNKRKAELEGAA